MKEYLVPNPSTFLLFNAGPRIWWHGWVTKFEVASSRTTRYHSRQSAFYEPSEMPFGTLRLPSSPPPRVGEERQFVEEGRESVDGLFPLDDAVM